MISNEWTVLCTTNIDSVELASVLLFDAGATAISETSLGDRVELRAGFRNQSDAQAAASAVPERLPETRCSAFLDSTRHDWIHAQRAGLSPTTIGRWTVRAPWHPESTATAMNSNYEVVIDPGAAFGHGAHESTRLAGELMMRNVAAHSTVVDLGTGTGILAILAAKQGATVRAIEHDPVAVDIAAQNIERNGLGDRIELTCGDAATEVITANDLVVVNVTLDVHRLLAPSYQRAGRIVTAGILCSQVSAIAALLEHHQIKTIRTSGDWAAIDFSFNDDHSEVRHIGRKG